MTQITRNSSNQHVLKQHGNMKEVWFVTDAKLVLAPILTLWDCQMIGVNVDFAEIWKKSDNLGIAGILHSKQDFFHYSRGSDNITFFYIWEKSGCHAPLLSSTEL